MEMGGNFCQILELGGLLLRDGEYYFCICECQYATHDSSYYLSVSNIIRYLRGVSSTNISPSIANYSFYTTMQVHQRAALFLWYR